jgi:hypothetical protein
LLLSGNNDVLRLFVLISIERTGGVELWRQGRKAAGLFAMEGLMGKNIFRVFTSFVLVFLLLSTFMIGTGLAAAQEDTIMGTVVKHGKDFVIESDEGDYIAKGKDLSKFVDKLVEVTGTITESEKGNSIQVKSIEEIQE